MKPVQKFLFILIIILASFLRLYKLSTIPPGINRDEGSIGYTAYSLLKTGKDEYGRVLPLSFESFGDWKLPLYIYTTIPFVKIFGLTELAVRLPSALSGILTVASVFFLTKILFANIPLALLSSFILAVMPWHIHISRVESESDIAILFSTIATILFLKAIKYKRAAYLTISGILFALTYYTYHGNHIFTTLYTLSLIFLYRKEVFHIPKWMLSAGIAVILVVTILIFTLRSADKTKISGIGIFGDPTIVHTHIELPRLSHNNPSSILSKLIHNKPAYVLITISQNYLKSYSPEFLFIRGGGNHAHNIQGYGNMHLIESLFLLLGICFALTHIKKREVRVVWWWLLIAGIAPSITKDAPHSNRMFAIVPVLSIIIAFGIQNAREFFLTKAKWIFPLLMCILYAGSLILYADAYFIHFPKEEATYWGLGYKQIAAIVNKEEFKNKNVLMTSPEESPYIYMIFYGTYDPSLYQKQAVRYPISSDGFTDVKSFGRFTFRAIDWGKDLALPDTLIISKAYEVPSSATRQIVDTIYLPNGETQFIVINTDK